MKHLVIGGVRSGKSDFAEQQLTELLKDTAQEHAIYIATSLAIGEETKSRIARHQLHRDSKIMTCELDYQSRTLSSFLTKYDTPKQLILIECLSTWVGWYLSQDKPLKQCVVEYEHVKAQFLEQLNNLQATVIIVTGEVGCGLIGETKLMRVYADKLGELNQQVARLANNVTVVTAGIAQKIKV
ncbi:adenosylcobinamide kinase/adenosylcobinamide phosphate guanyltransferase [Psychromonas marina]|uniref:Bifunctional adenosylcobalamin biosynthesis protein n=1 Tax=Psychromonas marina TaxID=88364 RepID=A0ABQ6DVT5_9GAMM|nr:bifunctional adenosylcobinamide kinase/adenosylcobinamide-phosphate guanylyltransferase [Psychromonas marina]GLS89211.1 adenosylcobinamide kinase/adenosylcobinamide phosphate guanyltransferase [Psychromonas marina]